MPLDTSSSRFSNFGLLTFALSSKSSHELYHKLKVHPNWGYVIYRTTYSPESDAHFSTAVKYVEAFVKKSFFRECASKNESSPSVDPAIYEEIQAKYSSTVIEDAALFDGASIDSIRAHFEAWVDVQGQRDSFNKYRMCIVIDEECLQTLLGTSAEALEQETEYKRDKTKRYVKIEHAASPPAIVLRYLDDDLLEASNSQRLIDRHQAHQCTSELRKWRILFRHISLRYIQRQSSDKQFCSSHLDIHI
ncbi:unnamed protein product [Penicillium roqueforti FM164]|uniref:Genomic scaffold, ProqFM164S01 n=1 Tax=Penicillium roqueforti (strain FM164) TaxID=1365484 RepID=W6PX18_PENRF|nr:unnamed protein product [Penicillium roqueforti FM164]